MINYNVYLSLFLKRVKFTKSNSYNQNLIISYQDYFQSFPFSPQFNNDYDCLRPLRGSLFGLLFILSTFPNENLIKR